MAFEKHPSWPFNASCFGPPCDPINGWAITEYQGAPLLHCGWSRRVTQEFIHGGDHNCPEFPGGMCPPAPRSIELANERWIKYFGGSGRNPNSGPFNNDCYHNNGMTRQDCTGYNCHPFPSRQIQELGGPDMVRLREVYT